MPLFDSDLILEINRKYPYSKRNLTCFKWSLQRFIGLPAANIRILLKQIYQML